MEKGTSTAADVTSDELAHLGAIAESEYERTVVRIVKLSWKTREGKQVIEALPRIDVRKVKRKGGFWGKGLSMKLAEYRRLRELIPAIDAELARLGIS